MVSGSLCLVLNANAGGGVPSDADHQVGIGDTIESIAKKYAGDKKHAHVIREMNPHLDKVGLQIGDYLFVPDQPLTEKADVSRRELERLPPNPLKQDGVIKIIPGVKYGLAHVYRPGGFKVVSAPVDRSKR